MNQTLRRTIFALLVLSISTWSIAAPTPTPKPSPSPTPFPTAFDQPPAVGARAVCPVSRETFTVTEKTERSAYKGKHYVFCCPGCKPGFDKEPEKYIAPTHQGGH
ncbi:MAG: YHS domain-containing protein [Vicinamibacteria bacterium]|nr:YHS domain-containing protein [Vicinamibacteria bacterium]